MRPPRTSRLRSGLALLAAVLIALAGLLPALALISRDAWREVGRTGPATLDSLVAALAGPVALAVDAWLLVAIVVTTADVLLRPVRARRAVRRAPRSARPITPGRWSRGDWFGPGPATQVAPAAPSRWAATVAPALLRQGIAALLGVTLLTATAAGAGASASGPSATARPEGTNTVRPTATSTLVTAVPGWIPAAPFAQTGSATTGTGPLAAGTSGQSSGTGTGIDAVTSTGRHRKVDDDGQLVVRRGDTLWSIAARSLGPEATEAQIAGEWPLWFRANRAVIGGDPDRLEPGQLLRPPAAAERNR